MKLFICQKPVALLVAMLCVWAMYAQPIPDKGPERAPSTCYPPQNPVLTSHYPEWHNVIIKWDLPVNEDKTQKLLFDNGPFVTAKGTGPNGADLSKLEFTCTYDKLGTSITHNDIRTQHVTDDFMLNNEAKIDFVEFYAFPHYTYPGTAIPKPMPTQSPFDIAFVRIFDGNPKTGGKLIWGNLVDNKLLETGFANCYRMSQSNMTDNQPIMYIRASIGITLSPGTYWVDVSVGALKAPSFATKVSAWALPVNTTTAPVGNAMLNASDDIEWVNWMAPKTVSTSVQANFAFKIYGVPEGPRGYNVYRNDSKINTKLVTERVYKEEVPAGNYTYGISAVYADAQTCESDKATVSLVMPEDPCATPLPMPIAESFDAAFDETCWHLSSATEKFWKVVAAGTNPACAPASGSGLLEYDCRTYGAGNRGVLRSPFLQLDESNYRLSFKMYRDLTAKYTAVADLINIYVSPTKSIAGLSPLMTINRSATLAPAAVSEGWYTYGVNLDCSAIESGYVFIEAVSAGGNNLQIDNIQLATGIFACDPPKNVEVATTVPTWKNVQLRWDGYEGVTYNIYRDGLKLNSSPTTATSYLDLVPEELTYVYAVTTIWDDGCESSPAIKSVKIKPEACATPISTFPFTEIFNQPGFPTCWTNDLLSGNVSWRLAGSKIGVPQTTHKGTYKLYFHSDNNTPGTTKLVLPVFDISTLKNPVLTFWHAQKRYINNQDTLRVYYKEAPAAKWKLLAEYKNDIPDWKEEIIVLPDASKTYWIAFEGSHGSSHGICLDDIAVTTSDKCTPVGNLNYTIEAKKVSIAWDEPSISTNLLTYSVYRNNTLVASNLTATSYSEQTALPVGIYSYAVEALYDNYCGVSEKTIIDNILIANDCGDKPKNLSVSAPKSPDWYNLDLKWDTPAEENWISYSGDYAGSIGQQSQTIDFAIAALWSPGDLTQLNNQTLAAVKFVPADRNCEYSIRVWEGGSATDPGTLIIDQPLNTNELTIGAWNNVLLTNPLKINGSKYLWIGIRCNMLATGRPAAYDSKVVAAYKGKSDMIYDGQKWYALSSVQAIGSWCIKGLVAASGSAQTLGYNVYRDGVKLNERLVFDNKYKDEIPAPGTYKYGVSVVQSNYCESAPIEKSMTVSQSPCEIPAPVTFEENFDDPQAFPKLCWKNEGSADSSYRWQNVTRYIQYPITAKPQSGTGMLGFNSYSLPTGTKTALITPLLDLGATNYTLTFWMYRHEVYSNIKHDSLNVYLTDQTGNYSETKPVISIHGNRHDSPKEPSIAWYQYTVKLDCSHLASGHLVFEGVSDNGGDIYIDNIKLERISHVITASAGSNGAIAPAGEVPVQDGANQTFQITAEAGYAIAEVMIDGVVVPDAAAASQYTFANVVAAHTISVSFTSAQYIINATAGNGGVIAPSGVVGAVANDSKRFTITPNKGYKVAQVLVDGINNPGAVSSRTYSFAAISANHTIDAQFAAQSTDATLKSITVSAGSLTPAFAPATTAYRVEVPNGTTGITLTGVKNNELATVDGNGAQPLSIGDNLFRLTVTAEDGTTTKTYDVTVHRRDNRAITLANFKLNNGAPIAAHQTVNLNYTVEGGIPTCFMASENSGFAGAAWKPYDVAALTYTFASNENGTKKVYTKLKNDAGETAVLSDDIFYKSLHAKLKLTSFTINNDSPRTANRLVTLNYTVENGQPTMYSVSENPLEVGTVWLTYLESPSFILSEGTGMKQIYLMVANEEGTSEVVESQIYLDESITVEYHGLTAAVYPNPADRIVHVEIRDRVEMPVTVNVYNMSGALYLSQSVNTPSFDLDLSKCPSGALLIRLSSGKNYVVKQLIKQ